MKERVEASKKLVLINSASAVVATAVNMAVWFWLQPYLLHRIGDEEYSLYPVLAAVMVFLPMFTMVIISGISRYVTEAYARGDDRRVVQIVSTMTVVLFGVGLAILIGGAFFCWFIDRILNIPAHRLWDARIMMGLMVLFFAIRVATTPFCVGLFVRQKFVLRNLILVGQEAVRITILLSLLFGVSTRVLWVVVATIGANLCGLIIILVVSVRLVPALRFRISQVRWWLFLTTIPQGISATMRPW